VNKPVIPAIVVAVGLGLWAFDAWFDRQEWLPESRAAKHMNHARLKCDAITSTDASSKTHPGWVDPHGRLFIVSGPGREADNAALDRCARANLGPGVPPVHWRTFLVIAAVLFGLSSIPLMASRRWTSRRSMDASQRSPPEQGHEPSREMKDP
jgi:hypothetical protein